MQVKSARIFDYGGGAWSRYALELDCDFNEVTHRYKRKPVGATRVAYFSEAQGYVSFMIHDRADENGYYKAVFDVSVELDGGTKTIERIKGPWSSNAAAMVHYGFPQAVDVRFQGCIAGHILLSEAEKILEQFKLPYHYGLYKPDWSLTPIKNTYILKPGRKG